MHERAVDLPRLHTAIFEKKNAVRSIEFPRCAKSCFDERKAPAKDYSFGISPLHRSAVEIHIPLRGRSEKGRFERRPIVAVGRARACIQTRCRHGAVKSDPP